MHTIWKFPLKLKEEQTIEMPEGAFVLTAQIQKGDICVWAALDPSAKMVPRQFRIAGTGFEAPAPDSGWMYAGTVQMEGYVWHVFWM